MTRVIIPECKKGIFRAEIPTLLRDLYREKSDRFGRLTDTGGWQSWSCLEDFTMWMWDWRFITKYDICSTV